MALVADFQVFTGSARLTDLSVYNSGASTVYVQLFDAAAVPADGATPVMVWELGSKTTLALEWGKGRFFEDGCVVVGSTTDTTKTLAGATLFVDAEYV